MSLMTAEDRGLLPLTRGLCGDHLHDPDHSVCRMNTKLARASCSVRYLAQTPAREHSAWRGVRTHIRGFAGADAAPQMAGPQLSKFPALLEEVRSQICPLHLIADLVVQRPFSFQQPLGMNLGEPVHERRSKAMHRVSLGQLLADQCLHRIIGLVA
jgi:hypothetical protein